MFTKDAHGKPNKQLFPKQVVIQLLYTAAASVLPIFYFKLQNKTRSRMDSCYSGDHIDRDHIHTDITAVM